MKGDLVVSDIKSLTLDHLALYSGHNGNEYLPPDKRLYVFHLPYLADNNNPWRAILLGFESFYRVTAGQ